MYKHILYATDLADINDAAAQKARQFADTFNAKLSLVHAIEPIPAYGYPDMGALESPIIESARKEIAKLGEQLNVETVDQHIEFGPVKVEILKVAEQGSVDCIVIGSHGRHGLSRLLGSGAQAITHAAECDVVIIRIK